MPLHFITPDIKVQKRYDMKRFLEWNVDNYDPLTSYVLHKLPQLSVFEYFTVNSEEQRPDTISYKAFNRDEQYWWLSLFYNEIVDYRDLTNGLRLNHFARRDLEGLLFSLKFEQRTLDISTATEEQSVTPTITSGCSNPHVGNAPPINKTCLWRPLDETTLYAWDYTRQKWLSTDQSVYFEGALSHDSVFEQYLYRIDSMPISVREFNAPYDLTLVRIEAEVDSDATFTIELRDDDGVVLPNGDIEVDSASTINLDTLNIDLAEDENFSIYLSGEVVAYPDVKVYYKKRRDV